MKKKKRPIFLLEIMIAILIIGLISGVLSYNMKGSLDQGRAFKTEQGIERLKEVLMLQAVSDQDHTIQEIADNPRPYLQNSGLFKDVDTALKDGWGKEYSFSVDSQGDLVVSSDALNTYKMNKIAIPKNKANEPNKQPKKKKKSGT